MRPLRSTIANRRPDAETARRPPHRFSVHQYERMIEAGIVREGEAVELLDGIVVRKMPKHPPHASCVEYSTEALRAVLPAEWRLRDQKPIRLRTSEPEPDVAVVRGPLSRYERRHPGPADVAFVIEVADSSLDEDRSDKARLYAQSGIARYWIVHLVEAQVEIYTEPRQGKQAGYRTRSNYGVSERVPVVLGGQEVGQVAVCDLLPSGRVG